MSSNPTVNQTCEIVLSLLLGVSGAFEKLGPPLPQVIIVVLTATILTLILRVPRFRWWIFSVDERILVAPHIFRFVGFYFLLMFQLGELPYRFAVPGGWGDIGIAALASLLISTLRADTMGGWCAYFAWNLAGFFEIIFVVGTATRIGLNDPGSMAALQRMPLCLLPAWLVPIIISTHLALGLRLLVKRP